MCGKFNIDRLTTVKEIKVNKENTGMYYTFEYNDEENEEDIYD